MTFPRSPSTWQTAHDQTHRIQSSSNTKVLALCREYMHAHTTPSAKKDVTAFLILTDNDGISGFYRDSNFFPYRKFTLNVFLQNPLPRLFAPCQTATYMGRSHPREQQPQPHVWESRAGKHHRGRGPSCKTRPPPFTPSFWGFQAGLFTQVQQSRNTCCLLQPGITPELINLADHSWLSALCFWKQTNGSWLWKEPVWVWGLLTQALHYAKE